MTSFEPVQAGPYPVAGVDAPDGPTQIKAVVDWAAGRLNMRFASTAARDAAIPAPVEGMECVTGTGAALVKWRYITAAWVDVTVRGALTQWVPVLTASVTSPTLGVGSSTVGVFQQVGKMIQGYGLINFGTSGVVAGSGTLIVSLPAPRNSVYIASGGRVRCAGLTTPIWVNGSGASTANIQYSSAAVNGALVTATNALPGIWVANDTIFYWFNYPTP